MEIATRVTRLRLGDLELLADGRNARYLRHEQYRQLVDNLRGDGGLTSVPFAARQSDGRYLVLSGNHRVMAAIDAFGPDREVDVMVTDEALGDQRSLALQLSHNAIAGEDDPAVLRALYQELDDVDWRSYTGLGDDVLGLLAEVDPVGLGEANLNFQNITFVFLPEELADVRAAFDEARKLAGPGEKWLMAMADYDAALDALAVVGGAHGITNQALALRLLVRLAETNFEQLVSAWFDENEAEPRRSRRWVPWAAIFGVSEIPPEAAAVIRAALVRMRSRAEVSPDANWQAVELWAADSLASP